MSVPQPKKVRVRKVNGLGYEVLIEQPGKPTVGAGFKRTLPEAQDCASAFFHGLKGVVATTGEALPVLETFCGNPPRLISFSTDREYYRIVAEEKRRARGS